LNYSPLRYPGGKSKLTPYVLETLKLNKLEGGIYVEPFAGGAAIAWHLLINGHIKEVYINDLNLSIYAFWYSVLNHTNELCELINHTDVTIDEWHKQKCIQKLPNAKLLDRGFSTFFLNRTNRSGIINAGAIGGLAQDGNYKIDCRFNKVRLIEQIRNIARRRDNIHLSNLDAIDFITEILPSIDDKCLVNIDPPYYVKGKGLYQNFFEHDDHYLLYERVKYIRQPWIVTYDDTPEINDIYHEFNPKPFELTYTAHTKKRGTELIIHNPILKVCKYSPDISFVELKKAKKLELKAQLDR
jgi:DNA adenine methylase